MTAAAGQCNVARGTRVADQAFAGLPLGSQQYDVAAVPEKSGSGRKATPARFASQSSISSCSALPFGSTSFTLTTLLLVNEPKKVEASDGESDTA